MGLTPVITPHVPDQRLNEDAFDAKSGVRLAQAFTPTNDRGCLVDSALTKTEYIRYDWATGQYIRERR
jgi:hypothetical protein